MSNDTTALVPTKEDVEQAITVKEGGELDLQATNAMQMGLCSVGLLKWSDHRIALMQGEADDLEAELAIAKKNRWRTEGLRRHHGLALKRVDYYKKFKSAIEAGFMPIPNLPGIKLFAVRTKTKKPTKKADASRQAWYNPEFEQATQKLPVGEGEYVNPEIPFIRYKGSDEDKDDDQYYFESVKEFQDIDFPVIMATPQLMEVTSRAMALKIFDEIGVLPPNQHQSTTKRRAADPMIVGHLIDPRPTGYLERKQVTFIIGWRLETASL